MTAVVVGVAVGITLIIGVMLAIHELAGADPPAEPADLLLGRQWSRDRLFQPVGWAKGGDIGREVVAPAYNRPLGVDVVPDNEILPPPREVRGVNREV